MLGLTIDPTLDVVQRTAEDLTRRVILPSMKIAAEVELEKGRKLAAQAKADATEGAKAGAASVLVFAGLGAFALWLLLRR